MFFFKYRVGTLPIGTQQYNFYTKKSPNLIFSFIKNKTKKGTSTVSTINNLQLQQKIQSGIFNFTQKFAVRILDKPGKEMKEIGFEMFGAVLRTPGPSVAIKYGQVQQVGSQLLHNMSRQKIIKVPSKNMPQVSGTICRIADPVYL